MGASTSFSDLGKARAHGALLRLFGQSCRATVTRAGRNRRSLST
jgi:hypothetical protein